MSQYAFSLCLPAAFSEDMFAVSACNKEAFDAIMRWPNWPQPTLIIYGEEGCGKTHLAHIWATRSQADIADVPVPNYQQVIRHLVLENVHGEHDEKALLHVINHCREHGYALLLTSAVAPKQLPFQLPDLTSRLRAMPAASIAPPDDEALAAALRKQFADRQLKISDEVIIYLLPRIERSFAKVKTMVATLDQQALREQRSLTVPFLKRVLGY